MNTAEGSTSLLRQHGSKWDGEVQNYAGRPLRQTTENDIILPIRVFFFLTSSLRGCPSTSSHREQGPQLRPLETGGLIFPSLWQQ